MNERFTRNVMGEWPDNTPGLPMKHDKETLDAADKYIANEMKNASPHWRLGASAGFLAGDAHGRLAERTRILEMLRSKECFHSSGYRHEKKLANEQFADWLEMKLK